MRSTYRRVSEASTRCILMAENQVRICVPVCGRSLSALERASARAGELGDLVEVGLDCLDRSELEQVSRLAKIGSRISKPVILTLRPAAEGGQGQIDDAYRWHFWNTHSHLFTQELFDLELDLVQELAKSASVIDWTRVICSHHDFGDPPA